MNTNQQHIHFIGISGSAIAPLAIMMKEKGWKVTGSDANCWEPAKSLFEKAGIEVATGEAQNDLTNVRAADIVIIGGAPLMINTENPEYVEAKRLGKELHGYAYLIRKYVVKPNNIVITGSYGKTTMSAMTAWTLTVAGKNPSFMSGGKPLNFDTGVKSTDSQWSVEEGDEYFSVFHHDEVPRFYRYEPKYAVLTATQHDHVNIYPTEESYIKAFRLLSDKVIENQGKLYISATGENNEKILKYHAENGGKFLTYHVEDLPNRISATLKTDATQATNPNGAIDYTARNIEFNENFTKFDVYLHDELIGSFETPLMGIHNVENSLGVIAVLHDLGIDVEAIREGVKTFKNVARRLQYKGKLDTGAKVYDDFAHSPPKVKATLDALRTRFPKQKIVVMFSPRLSNNEGKESIEPYEGMFDQADFVIIPKIIVKASQDKSKRIFGRDFVEIISRTQPNVAYMPKQEQIIDYLKENTDDNSIFVIMSAKSQDELLEALEVKESE